MSWVWWYGTEEPAVERASHRQHRIVYGLTTSPSVGTGVPSLPYERAERAARM